jgi:hypothetical protein
MILEDRLESVKVRDWDCLVGECRELLGVSFADMWERRGGEVSGKRGGGKWSRLVMRTSEMVSAGIELLEHLASRLTLLWGERKVN